MPKLPLPVVRDERKDIKDRESDSAAAFFEETGSLERMRPGQMVMSPEEGLNFLRVRHGMKDIDSEKANKLPCELNVSPNRDEGIPGTAPKHRVQGCGSEDIVDRSLPDEKSGAERTIPCLKCH